MRQQVYTKKMIKRVLSLKVSFYPLVRIQAANSASIITAWNYWSHINISKILVCENFRSHPHISYIFFRTCAGVQICEFIKDFAHSHTFPYATMHKPLQMHVCAHTKSCLPSIFDIRNSPTVVSPFKGISHGHSVDKDTDDFWCCTNWKLISHIWLSNGYIFSLNSHVKISLYFRRAVIWASWPWNRL